MKRDLYVVRDAIGHRVAEILTPEGETPEIETWMAENVRNRGWSIEKIIRPQSEHQIDVHGYADWRSIAGELAEAIRPILSGGDSEQDDEEILSGAQAALDAYDVALMEVSMDSVVVEKEEGSDDS